MISGKNNPELKVYEVTYVAHKPNFNAYKNKVSPETMMPNYNRPRFDWRKIHPDNDGFGNTRWMVVEGIQTHEDQCPTCTQMYTRGTMSCTNCGAFLNNASDLCKAAQLTSELKRWHQTLGSKLPWTWSRMTDCKDLD